MWLVKGNTRNTGMKIIGVQPGFTLVELMVTVTLVAILASSAYPHLYTFVINNQVRAQVNSLLTDLNYTRLEAIRSGNHGLMCASNNGKSCSHSADDWHRGWIVFQDRNNNRQRDSEEALLRVREPFESGQLKFRAFMFQGKVVRYSALGFAHTNGTFSLCDAEGAVLRGIVIAATGRPRVIPASQDENLPRCS